MSSLEKSLFLSFARFLLGLFIVLEWSHVSSLFILEIKLLSEISLTNMFSHRVGSLFILVMISLAMHKLFMWMRSHLFIFSFMSLDLGEILVTILLCGTSHIFQPMFSSMTLIVSKLMLKSFIHLEFIFVIV